MNISLEPKGPYTGTAILENEAYDLLKNIEKGLSLTELSLQHPALYFKYNNAFEKFIELHKPKTTFNIIEEYGEFLPWQKDLIETYLSVLKKRFVYWIYGINGNEGKSELSFHLEDVDDYNVISNGKSADMSYLFVPNQHTIIDLCRSNDGHVNYDMIEAFKNGRLTSTKYIPKRKRGKNDCHVIIFANFYPDFNALSHDRWVLLEITSINEPLKKWKINDIINLNKESKSNLDV
jgi:hypothetical protein